MTFALHHGDCLEVMQAIPDGSVDMILCDLPYGTTACKWDTIIPFEPLWAHYRRIAKRNAAIVLTAAMPFTAALVMSQPKMFRHAWVWNKRLAANGPLARFQPLRVTEDVLVFGEGITYQPQGVTDCHKVNYRSATEIGASGKHTYIQTKTGYPSNVLEFSAAARNNKLHPTQKPVALMEYLIRTYTQEGETVLDSCMGSGTTGVACANTGRRFIGIERDDKYFAIASERIAAAQMVEAA